jgi:hypothetical protein
MRHSARRHIVASAGRARIYKALTKILMTTTTLGRVVGSLAVAALLAGSSVAFAQTYDTSNTGSNGTVNSTSNTGTTGGMGGAGDTSSTTPGVPNTGTGADTSSMALLAVAAVAVVAGAAYLIATPRRIDDVV